MRVPHSEDFPVIIGSIILCNSLKGVGKKIAGKVLKEKVKETFKNPQNNPTQTQETWTQVGADQNGWVYYQSNYGRRMAKNVYTGQEVPL